MFSRVIINILIILILTAALVVWVYPKFMGSPAPCEEPITYALGSFDRRFNISQKTFLDALATAESIWEKPINKELFIHEQEKGELTVNLIYDERQEVTDTLSGLGSVVEEDEATYNSLRARYLALKVEYDTAKSVYNALVENFNDRNNAYQMMVESWNKGKRNSKEQFEQLEQERASLQAEAGKLRVLETQLNEVVREINTLVETLNRIARSLNLNVETYNTIGATRGESFTGGLYSQDEEGRSIDIYEFSSREKLVRVLEHVSDPKAIMYYLNEGEAGTLTETDLSALQTLCYTE